MRASCAPYKDCWKGGATKGGPTKGGATKRKKKITYKKNILGTPLKRCSTQPKTGFYRNGYCMTGPDDLGIPSVCYDESRLLDYTASKGNDLSSVVKDGQRWCLCESLVTSV